MALKPILEQALLTSSARMPLRTGSVKINRPEWMAMATLLDEQAQNGTLPIQRLEAAVRLDDLCDTTAAADAARSCLSGWTAEEMTADRLSDAVGLMRAAWALYEATVDPTLLEQMMAFAAWLYAHPTETEACRELRVAPADLMELLTNLYRVTARKGLLKLLDRLRGSAMKWESVLHSFDVQSPMKKLADAETLRHQMEAEKSEEGFYTRQYLTCHGETLADGGRSALAVSVFTGSKHAETAVDAGWLRLQQWHGNALGMIGADEMLAGKSPAALMDAAAIGAWMETFAAHAPLRLNGNMMHMLMTLTENALPLLVGDGAIQDSLRLNVLAGVDDKRDAFLWSPNQPERAVTRLARAMASIASAAVDATDDGADVLLLLDGSYAFRLGGVPAVMTVCCEDEKATLHLKLKRCATGVLRIRMPAGAEQVKVLFGEETIQSKAGELLVLDDVWQKETTVTLTWKNSLRMVSGHHQGLSVWYGTKLMALPIEEGTEWRFAVCGRAKLKDGAVLLPVQPIEWHQNGVLPADVPVLPRAIGERRWVRLKPITETKARIAVFPRAAEA